MILFPMILSLPLTRFALADDRIMKNKIMGTSRTTKIFEKNKNLGLQCHGWARMKTKSLSGQLPCNLISARRDI